MYTFADFDNVSRMVVQILSEACDEAECSLESKDLADVIVPDSWLLRIRSADEALLQLIDTELSALIPENELEGRLREVCEPDDDALEVFCGGDPTLVARLSTAIDNGELLQEVMEAIRDGELNALFEDL